MKKKSAMIDIAVAIPTYNSEKYVATAIKSVKSQSIHNIPIYIFDNHSTDRTVAISQKFDNVTIHQNEQNYGFSANLKNCFYITPHQFVALLCSDDWFEENHLEVAINTFMENSEIQYYFCFAKLKYEDALQPDRFFQHPISNNIIPPMFLFNRLLKSHIIPISSLVVNKNVLEKVPGECWERKLSDWEFAIHISNNYTGWCEKRYNVCFLQRPSSMGQQWYLEKGYSLNRMNLFFTINKIYSISNKAALNIIIHRYLEAFIIAIYKLESGLSLKEIVREINEIEKVVKSMMAGHRTLQLFLFLSRIFFIRLLQLKLFRSIIIKFTKVFGIGKFIIAEPD